MSALEGAVGYTPPPDEIMPEWKGNEPEEESDELHEIRRRRLQKFSTGQAATQDKPESSGVLGSLSGSGTGAVKDPDKRSNQDLDLD